VDARLEALERVGVDVISSFVKALNDIDDMLFILEPPWQVKLHQKVLSFDQHVLVVQVLLLDLIPKLRERLLLYSELPSESGDVDDFTLVHEYLLQVVFLHRQCRVPHFDADR